MENRKRIEEKVFSFIREQHMLEPGERVAVGVSGGADSVCLLFVLLEWAKQCPLELAVVHVNHGVRQDAGQDAEYVRSLCEQRGISFYLREEDVPARAEREKLSEEEAGRLTRYEAFYEVAQGYGDCKIAVAHNANDRAETMLFHLLRGSGLSGLCSIRPVRGQIIRPLLCLERREIEQYLRERGIPWRTDSTNGEDSYTRNRIRHHILPYAEQEIAEGCVAHMFRTAEMLTETEEYLRQQTEEAKKSCVRRLGEHPWAEKARTEGEQLKGIGTEVSLPEGEQLKSIGTEISLPEGEQLKSIGTEVSLPEGEQLKGIGTEVSLPEGEQLKEIDPEGFPPEIAQSGSVQAKGFRVETAGFQKLHTVLQKRLLYELLKELTPEQKDIAYVHVQAVLTLFDRQGNRSISLPYGICCRRQYGEVLMEREQLKREGRERQTGECQTGECQTGECKIRECQTGECKIRERQAGECKTRERQSGECQTGERQAGEYQVREYHLDISKLPKEGSSFFLEGLGEVEIKILSYEKREDIPENQYTKWFDYDKMKKSLVMRKRQTGDYLTIKGRSPEELRHKSIKDYMIAEKIPRTERDGIWLLAQEHHIVWVVGRRISEYYKINENTKRILQVQLKRSSQE